LPVPPLRETKAIVSMAPCPQCAFFSGYPLNARGHQEIDEHR
jgi:hypothetical protein